MSEENKENKKRSIDEIDDELNSILGDLEKIENEFSEDINEQSTDEPDKFLDEIDKITSDFDRLKQSSSEIKDIINKTKNDEPELIQNDVKKINSDFDRLQQSSSEMKDLLRKTKFSNETIETEENYIDKELKKINDNDEIVEFIQDKSSEINNKTTSKDGEDIKKTQHTEISSKELDQIDKVEKLLNVDTPSKIKFDLSIPMEFTDDKTVEEKQLDIEKDRLNIDYIDENTTEPVEKVEISKEISKEEVVKKDTSKPVEKVEISKEISKEKVVKKDTSKPVEKVEISKEISKEKEVKNDTSKPVEKVEISKTNSKKKSKKSGPRKLKPVKFTKNLKIGVTRFPGTNNEHESIRVLESFGVSAEIINSFDIDKISNLDGIWIAGGFSYADVLRAGAVASVSDLMNEIKKHDKPILGICNGFQILTETNLLPGSLIPNKSTKFICDWIHVKIPENDSYLSNLAGATLRLPIAHFEGNLYAESLSDVRPYQVAHYSNYKGLIKSSFNPNGSIGNIAGLGNKNIVGMMPHPERASFSYQGSTDGRRITDAFLREAKK